MIAPITSRGVRAALAIAASLAMMAGGGLSTAVAMTGGGRAATATEATVRVTGQGAVRRPALTPRVSPPACADHAYALRGARWSSSFRWEFKVSSTPSGLTRNAARRAIGRGIANLTAEHNDCGRPDKVSASSVFLGDTTRAPSVSADGVCGPADGHSVLGFGRLNDLAAFTCVWSHDGRITEADTKFSTGMRWTTKLTGCVNQLMLQAVATTTAGYAFGLLPVSETDHGRLTMSSSTDGYCEDAETTLGLGDMLGLERLY